MNIRRRGRGKKIIAIVITFVITASIVLGGIFFFRNSLLAGGEATSSSTKPPLFSFANAPGWWRSAINETSMTLYDSGSECSITATYSPETIDVAADLQHTRNTLAKENYTMTELGTQTLPFQTIAGPQTYDLHEFSVTSSHEAQYLQEGQEIGYIQLSDGYVKLSGSCDAPTQLQSTLVALKAIHIAKH